MNAVDSWMLLRTSASRRQGGSASWKRCADGRPAEQLVASVSHQSAPSLEKPRGESDDFWTQ